jgi:endonuclease/exonuclease/phosphatase family metal-dependent hydrolase
MSASLKLVQLNIEGNKHLDVVLPFLREQAADVVCLQELCEEDAGSFEEALNATHFYTRMSRGPDNLVYGSAIFSKVPILRSLSLQYGGSAEELPDFNRTNIRTVHDSQRFSLSVCDLEKDGEVFRIGTTHFPVTEKGQPTDFQRTDMRALLDLLKQQGELVFTGDFNAPRGGEIFSMLAECYQDNVPLQYKTSLDLTLHRASKAHPDELVDKMVDGIFSTPGYVVSDVSMHGGVSDHCALVATITKRL